MELNLKPMIPKPFFEGEDGSLYKWFPSDFPLLAHYKVAAGRVLLRPRAFAIPHYSDSNKVGYIVQGEGIAGLIFPNKQEESVVNLKKGDIIPVAEGVTSWWFNNGDSDFQILFLAETKTGLVPGDITYFILTGPLGILQSFSPEYVSKIYNLTEEETNILLKSQTGALIFKLGEEKTLPKPHEHSKLVYNINNAVPEFKIEGGGSVTTVTESKFPFIGQSGLTAVHEKLEANAVRTPVYGADPAVQLVYIVSGSGRIHIVGFAGKEDVEVKAGELILIPRYFVVGKIAGEEGLECFSIVTTTHPVVEELAGKTSVFEALSPEVSQISFNLTAEFEKLLRSKITKSTPLVSPTD